MRLSFPSNSLPLIIAIAICQITSAQEPEVSVTPPLDESGNLVRFERDIAPILRSRCLKCHGPDEAKEDLRVDDPEIFLGYVEPGDVEASVLYTDYLTTDDEDLRMPPSDKNDPLSAGELALFRVWIEEGADWPEGFQVSHTQIVTEPPPVETLTIADRVMIAIGYLHPATVHFPIALFLLGAAFVVVGWKWPAVGTQIPLACLLSGAATAIASSAMGWSLAPTKGYGAGWEFLSFERAVDVHRWSGVIVTVLSCISSIVALMAFWKDSIRLHKAWRVGLLICGIAIGLVGHKGGEMAYGPNFYPDMMRVLLGNVEQEKTDVESTPVEPTAGP